MDESKVFRTFSSQNGHTWAFDPKEDDDHSWWVTRRAKERSLTSGKYERVVNMRTNSVIITFFKGASIQLTDLGTQ